MAQAAIFILAGTDSPADTGRMVNGLQAAKEFREDDADDLQLIFDGAGTQWVEELENEDHDYHDLYQSVNDQAGVCDYCSSAFGADEAVEDAGLVQIDENEGHPSIRSLVDEGYQVLTF